MFGFHLTFLDFRVFYWMKQQELTKISNQSSLLGYSPQRPSFPVGTARWDLSAQCAGCLTLQCLGAVALLIFQGGWAVKYSVILTSFLLFPCLFKLALESVCFQLPFQFHIHNSLALAWNLGSWFKKHLLRCKGWLSLEYCFIPLNVGSGWVKRNWKSVRKPEFLPVIPLHCK